MLSFSRLAILIFCQHKSQHLINHPTINSNYFTVPRSCYNQFSSITKRPFSSTTAVFLLSSVTSILTSKSVVSVSTSSAESLSSSSSTRSHSTSRNPILCQSSNSKNSYNNINMPIETGYLNAEDAYDLDQQLFSTGYTLEQLMELAGLAVAEAVYDVSPPCTEQKQRALIVCGPGNNGGDGLVAGRHLVMFGYDVVVVYPKRSSREPHYSKLVKQCEDVGVQVLDDIPGHVDEKFDIIVDAIFGFSFKGQAREPFASIIQTMMEMQQKQQALIIAVDVPSGWNVDEGDVANTQERREAILVKIGNKTMQTI